MNKHEARGQAGFTMLEVLISMVIIAFGLLGVAGLQAFALKNNQSAHYRSVATMLAADIGDRMRSNYLGVIDLMYNQPGLSAYGTEVSACKSASGCTSTQLAQNDLFEWQARVAASLPGGVGILCIDVTPHDGPTSADPQCDNSAGTNFTNYVVKIWWTDDRNQRSDLAAPTPQRFSTPLNP